MGGEGHSWRQAQGSLQTCHWPLSLPYSSLTAQAGRSRGRGLGVCLTLRLEVPPGVPQDGRFSPPPLAPPHGAAGEDRTCGCVCPRGGPGTLCPLSLGWVECSLGSQGCSGLMQGRQGPQGRTLDGTLARHLGFTSSGVACGKSGHRPLSSYNKTAPFLAPENPLLLCIVEMGAKEESLSPLLV